MSDALGWAGIVAVIVGVDWACERVFGASTRDLGQRWAARIDAWFARKEKP
jgi:hypothetical protein